MVAYRAGSWVGDPWVAPVPLWEVDENPHYTASVMGHDDLQCHCHVSLDATQWLTECRPVPTVQDLWVSEMVAVAVVDETLEYSVLSVVAAD